MHLAGAHPGGGALGAGRLSRGDHLTGCLNRLGFAERLTTELARLTSRGGVFTLVVLDFDDFKAVNDHRGHSAGDELLCWAAGGMAGVLRPADALGRLGGDEFAALLPDTDAEPGRYVADRLRLALSERISVSAGMACTRQDGLSADTLYHCADERLYEAKRRRPATHDQPALAG